MDQSSLLSAPRRCCALACSIALALAASGCAGSVGAVAGGTVIGVTERDFQISTSIAHVRAGEVWLRISNQGPDEHELIVAPERKAGLPMRSDGFTVSEEAIQSSEPGSGHPPATWGLRISQAAPRARALRTVLQHGGALHGRHAHRAGGGMKLSMGRRFRPFKANGRRSIFVIFVIFGLISALSVALSISATDRSKNQAGRCRGRRSSAHAGRAVRQGSAARAGRPARPSPALPLPCWPTAPLRCSTAEPPRRSTVMMTRPS